MGSTDQAQSGAFDPTLEGDALLPATERRLEASLGIDELTTAEFLTLLNEQDRTAIDAVAAVIPQVAELVEFAAARFVQGGRIHYFGAGTSGRLAVLDAAELLPTFNLEPDLVVAHIAGGERALIRAVEDAEDSPQEGRHAAASLGPLDVAIGLTASGNTPYVGGALSAAREAGSVTALISCNEFASLAPLADVNVVLHTGAEVITGSTRLKAGTAEKLVLNGFSTALMVAVGRTWSNLMVSVVATNEKLRRRTIRILMQATSLDEQAAREVLAHCDGELKTAIVATIARVDPEHARSALADAQQSVRGALHLLDAPPRS
ncbi:N-acetylmuramic acid 6-phosphate etherase [Microbacterium mitrae]|uniref:N-acetylmuramic acid 6-phosphate etherase n=1 Tax=Microbacterium mitrae TaxID=664640 RepID=A0A5C8HLM2_9MICO|nr:N-acetylmuramic acid 6-phosphate etherase [Microbacterium mitrae]TXK02495.1 N-acetylmuramic acid 6-phosphate etherase [Microbacterium mitrae]